MNKRTFYEWIETAKKLLGKYDNVVVVSAARMDGYRIGDLKAELSHLAAEWNARTMENGRSDLVQRLVIVFAYIKNRKEIL